MSRVAMIEYFTTAEHTLIFLAKSDLEAPLVFEARVGDDGRPVTKQDLLDCAARLLIDFHGLPPGWDRGEGSGDFKALLSLPPAVHAAKRSKPVLERTLNKPAFAYYLTYWEWLSEALLPVGLRTQVADCQVLCIVPHGPLHALPFAALRWSEHEYLIERFGLCYTHSATMLRYCQEKNRRRSEGPSYRPASCLIAAVAAADDEAPQDFEADGETLAALFQDGTASGQVMALVGASAGENRQPASKMRFCQMAGGYEVVHLACHGVFALDGTGDNALDSGLLLSNGQFSLSLAALKGMTPPERADYFLTALEVFGLELSANLITLRACSSGRASVYIGDELLGLTRAFLYAGTPSLLVSLWNVNKRSSRRLLNDFYRLWLDRTNPLPKWQAFQQAQVGLLTDPTGDYRHPYHWAPFILMGDWL